ncbi:hypothetical protein AVEN_46737-1 [Araneus ventricosus]|uniref:Uncharacterized protein n=1 Tax=Araneus ventricosus TaxID=182803 RepID=A0A4Y2SMB0_ARAVE|nr:hypothetical protein AVEN_193413-1 [Araneus ventricosus]GBN89052.1 hypothetical protein AVEN_46737-1 [Araneus ventricosus]
MRNTEGRYKISRLNKRWIICRTVHQRDTFPAKMLSATHGVKKRTFLVLSSDFSDSQTNTTEISLRPFTFSVSLPSFLNTLPSKDREVVVVLPPGDSSSSWTNHPTALVCLPSWC